MPVSHADASRVIQAAHAKAVALGVRITVAIVDEGAHIVAVGRMDGAMPLSPKIAEGKAVGAALLARDGAALAQMAQDRPAFFSAISAMSKVPMVPGTGSLLIKNEGVIVGAIGISGAKPEQDLECAEAALGAL
jgi:glc operon protein GlcG